MKSSVGRRKGKTETNVDEQGINVGKWRDGMIQVAVTCKKTLGYFAFLLSSVPDYFSLSNLLIKPCSSLFSV